MIPTNRTPANRNIPTLSIDLEDFGKKGPTALDSIYAESPTEKQKT